MKQFIVVALLSIVSTLALATGNGNNGNNGQGDTSAIAGANSTSSAKSIAASLAVSGAAAVSGSSSQGGASTAGSVSGGSSSSVTVTTPSTVHYEGGYTVRNTPDAPAMIASPTAPCRIAISGSAAGAGIAIGIGSSVLDTGCDTREDARLLVNMGFFSEALARLCQKPEIATALGSQCPIK